MKKYVFILMFVFCDLALAQSKFAVLDKANWLKGNWKADYRGNKLELSFSGTEGGTILSTYKQLKPSNDLVFMRFLNITEASGKLQMRLFPFLALNPDGYSSTTVSENSLIFVREYSDNKCALTDIESAINDNEELQTICDRFPIKITFEQTPDGSLNEIFYGFKPSNGKQTHVSFSRTYKKQ